eukprot:3170611-Rhodomonas_salina.2
MSRRAAEHQGSLVAFPGFNSSLPGHHFTLRGTTYEQCTFSAPPAVCCLLKMLMMCVPMTASLASSPLLSPSISSNCLLLLGD